MLVTSQLSIQTAKIFYSIFDVPLCPPHFEKGSATHDAHWNKHLLNVKFSYKEHCWWSTSRTCVNRLINETNDKYGESPRYQFQILLFIRRKATQNMSAARNSPTIGLNLRGLLLSAVIVSLHYFPRCLRSIVTCGQNAFHGDLMPIFEDLFSILLLRNKGQKQNNSLPSFATCLYRQRSGFSELQAHHCMLLEQTTWLMCSVSVITANKLSLQELTQPIRIKLLISRFYKIFAS